MSHKKLVTNKSKKGREVIHGHGVGSFCSILFRSWVGVKAVALKKTELEGHLRAVWRVWVLVWFDYVWLTSDFHELHSTIPEHAKQPPRKKMKNDEKGICLGKCFHLGAIFDFESNQGCPSAWMFWNGFHQGFQGFVTSNLGVNHLRTHTSAREERIQRTDAFWGRAFQRLLGAGIWWGSAMGRAWGSCCEIRCKSHQTFFGKIVHNDSKWVFWKDGRWFYHAFVSFSSVSNFGSNQGCPSVWMFWNGFHQGFQGFVTSNLGVNHLRTHTSAREERIQRTDAFWGRAFQRLLGAGIWWGSAMGRAWGSCCEIRCKSHQTFFGKIVHNDSKWVFWKDGRWFYHAFVSFSSVSNFGSNQGCPSAWMFWNGFHQGFQGFVTSNLGVNHLRTHTSAREERIQRTDAFWGRAFQRLLGAGIWWGSAMGRAWGSCCEIRCKSHQTFFGKIVHNDSKWVFWKDGRWFYHAFVSFSSVSNFGSNQGCPSAWMFWNGFHQGFQGFVTSNLGVNHLRTLFCVRGWKGVRGFKSAIPQRYLVNSFPTKLCKNIPKSYIWFPAWECQACSTARRIKLATGFPPPAQNLQHTLHHHMVL